MLCDGTMTPFLTCAIKIFTFFFLDFSHNFEVLGKDTCMWRLCVCAARERG